MLNESNYEEILKVQELSPYEFREKAKELLEAYNAGELDHFVFDIETKDLNMFDPTCGLIGFSFAEGKNKIGYFVGYNHPDILKTEKEKQIILSCLFKLLYNIPVVGHNLMFDLGYLVYQYDLKLSNVKILDDTLFMAYYIFGVKRDSGISLSLKNMFRHVFGLNLMWEEELSNALNSHKRLKDRHFYNVSYEIISKYGAYDSLVTYYLRLGLKEKLQGRVMHAYNFLIEAIYTFVELETTGIAIDWNFRDYLKTCYSEKIRQFEEEFQNINIIQTWKEDHFQEFNLNSSKMVGDVLYGKDYFNCPVVMLTPKGAPSTSENALLELMSNNSVSGEAKNFLKELLENRNSVKMVTTYLEPLDERKIRGSMYSPDYNLIGTATGRISSYFHTLPSGNDIKRMIISRWNSEGGLIVASDFSQIEVRIVGGLSRDEALKTAYLKGYDVHAYVASIIYNTTPELVSKKQRKFAKTVVFGILYGKSSYSLARELEIPEEEAQQLLDYFFKGFPKIKTWIDQQHRFLKTNKYVTTHFGRRRYLLDIDSTEWKRIAEAKRAAQNSPIQSTASDIALDSVLRISKELREGDYKSKFLGAVHDSILVDTHPTELQKVLKMMKYHMNDFINQNYAFLNGLPVKSDFEVGLSWGGSCALDSFGEDVWVCSGAELDAKNLVSQIKKFNPDLKVSSFQDVETNEDAIIKFVNPGKKVKFKLIF